MSQKLSALFIIALLLVGTVSVSSNFALADDKDKGKKPKTLQDYCAALDDKTGFPALVCAAISGITSSIQNLQDQINQMQFTAQRCPPGQEMVGINVNRQIICENPNFQSSVSVIVTLNPISIPIPPINIPVPIALAAVGLSPNSQVIVDDGLGHQIGTGTTDNKGGLSFSNLGVDHLTPVGTYTVRVTDQNGRTGSAQFSVISPPPPPPPASVQLNPTSGPAGTLISLTASGLTPNSIVSVSVQTPPYPLASGPADSTGHYSTSFTVPSGAPTGITYQIVVTDSHGITGSAGFLLTP